MLVPSESLNPLGSQRPPTHPPLGTVERTLTPGAAISTSAPKLLNDASDSSGPRGVSGPRPPGRPSESARAETVITSGYVAGVVFAASTALFMAATTTGTPAATVRQKA